MAFSLKKAGCCTLFIGEQQLNDKVEIKPRLTTLFVRKEKFPVYAWEKGFAARFSGLCVSVCVKWQTTQTGRDFVKGNKDKDA